MKYLVILGLFFFIGCGGAPENPADGKLVVIGFDAADWLVIDKLIDEGEMPNFSSFRDSGTSGTLMSFTPLEKSPRIWTSIATGFHPRDHGVKGFLNKDSKLTKSSEWNVPSLWDIAGRTGRSSCVVGWWITWPAKAMYDGVIVSDHITYTRAGSRGPNNVAWPDSLNDTINEYYVDWQSITNQQLGRFIDLSALSGHEDEYSKQLENLKMLYAGDLTYLKTIKGLVSEDDFDLTAVYFRGLDLACHKYWSYWKTETAPREYSELDIEILGNIVPQYYKFVDELLGEVLALFPADRQVAIMSDHGFYGPRHRKSGWAFGVNEHRPQGIFVVRSPIYKPSVNFERMEMLDTAPTLLAMLGLPASLEMSGEVLSAGLSDDGRKFVESLIENKVDSYNSFLSAKEDIDVEQNGVDDEVKKQLKSLGYIN